MTLRSWKTLSLAAATALLAGACEKAEAPAGNSAGKSPVADAPADKSAAGSDLPITPEADEAAMVAEGRQIAETNCGACHATGPTGESSREDAPPLRDLLQRYDSDALAEDLIDGVKVGHEDMPNFDFTVAAADALVAYLKALEAGKDR